MSEAPSYSKAAAWQRSALVDQRLIVGDPGLSFRQFVHGRIGANDLGDRHVIDQANRLNDVVVGQVSHGLSSLRLPSGCRGPLSWPRRRLRGRVTTSRLL